MSSIQKPTQTPVSPIQPTGPEPTQNDATQTQSSSTPAGPSVNLPPVPQPNSGAPVSTSLDALVSPENVPPPSSTEPTVAQRGARIWNNFRRADRDTHQAAAAEAFGLPRNWHIYRSSSMSAYAPIYGMIEVSAERHGLRPEFLQAVIMGEGLSGFIDNQRELGASYAPDIEIDGYQYLGTDEIGDPAHLQALVDEGGLDSSVANRVTPYSVVNELGENKTTARVRGYEAAIELVASELHRRRDQILGYANTQGVDLTTMPGYPGYAEDFLTYAQYNNPSVARDAVNRPEVYLRPWSGPERTDERNVRYNTMVRLATADWYRRARVYTP